MADFQEASLDLSFRKYLPAANEKSPFLFGRKWRLTIQLYRGDSVVIGNDPSSGKVVDLHVLFNIEKAILCIQQTSIFTIYNLSADMETDILKNGFKVTMEAGYQNGPYGQIFTGFIRQPIRGKENATDYYLRLVCMNADDALHLGFSNFTMASGATLQQVAASVARSSTVPFDIQIDEGFSDQKLQRGKTVFGSPTEILENIAKAADASLTFQDDKGTISKFTKAPPSTMPDLNAKTGLIGVPQQSGYGVSVRTLIRPDLTLDGWFHLNNQDIVLAQVEFGDLQLVLDRDGHYHIIEIVYSGDTRGNDWYMDINAVSQEGAVPEMLADMSKQGLR